MQMFNVQNLISFILLSLIKVSIFTPVCFLPALLCFALLLFFLLFPVCSAFTNFLFIFSFLIMCLVSIKIVSECDQEIPQSQTADNPKAPGGRVTQPSRGTRETNQAKQPALSSPSR